MRLGVSASRNPFDVGAEVREQDIAGSSTSVEGYLDRSMIRSREMNVGGRAGLRRTQEDTSIAGTPIRHHELTCPTSTIVGYVVWASKNAEPP
jgi:hypothetical protein